MQPEVTDRIMTAQMRCDLREFLDGYGEDVLGHYPPSLLFDNEPNYHRPVDPHYYQAQGQEVPPPIKKPWYKDAEVVAMLLTMFGVWFLLAFCNYWSGL